VRSRAAASTPSIVAGLERSHRDGTTDSTEYQQASGVYYQRHLCRLDPPPDEVLRTFAARESDPTVYAAMAGSSEFNPTGTLRDWDITDRLDEIDVPTLVISGRYDEATPTVVEPIVRGIPGAEWVLFESSSHMPHVEEHDRYISVVGAFLGSVES
jgi:L-proline amide hydrolase